MKKITSLFLSFVFAFFTFSVIVATNDSCDVSAAKIYETPYYYNQLSDSAQNAYDDLKEAVLNCEKKVKIAYSITNDDFNKIAELLILHDPMTFNLKDIEATSVTGRSITFKLSYRYTYESYKKMVASYEKKVNKILDRLDDDMTTYSKIKIIHDSIINTAVYDIDYNLSDTVYGTLSKGRGKCDGYAKTFAYVCGKAGIRAVTVIGTDVYTSDDSMHMWNKVYYNKKWYNVDVTWDDPVSNMKDNRKYEFFMLSDKDMRKTHTEDNLSFSVPAAKDSSRTYFKVYKKYAESLSDAKSIIKSELQKAVKSKKTHITIQCSSDEVYDSVCKYVLNTEKISSVLKNVNKNYNSDLIYDIYSYGFNDIHRTVKVYIFYDETDLTDYFTSAEEASDEIVNTLASYGIR
ncbi:MAG: hypothetical protein J6A05_04775 [Oscillospiraceae bacterium]|nr:hypothetical protein [Oscillospiraceae bacterium]